MSVSSATNTPTVPVPQEIDTFFHSLYGKTPEVKKESSDTRYFVAGKEISILVDKYKGFNIYIKDFSQRQTQRVQRAIDTAWKDCKAPKGRKTYDCFSMYIGLPINQRRLKAIIPDSFIFGDPKKGDQVRDYQQNAMKIWQWLNKKKECTVPSGATHVIGATALLLDLKCKKALLIENTCRPGSWNLPGGSFDPRKDKTLVDTALRELQEETGLHLEGKKIETLHPRIVGHIEFPKNKLAPANNQTFAFFSNNISKKPLHPPGREIKQAKWLRFKELEKLEGAKKEAMQLDGLSIREEITGPLQAAIAGAGCRLVAAEDWKIVYAEVLPHRTSKGRKTR